ncbi:juvenile hormone epoxide hydrolase [Manduca sexta]|uniref:Glutathione peroxidase n=1 Tax=Manduca sexta TaxID=7130 RepID=A0A921ZP90_MANSE|nr:juvenile hormone epoxide hydrolase [Manduca sexta]KAG6460532.1 hypothetical protein O3G_MSEX012037 [Manduca sexta]KAG6460533.1 hypothetical protein O3G_MSEX012037 [Manduca sexta]
MTKSNEKKTSGHSYPFLTFFIVTIVITFTVTWYVHKRLMIPPKMPKLDKNEWWGPVPQHIDPDESIQPFRIEFSDVMINDLRERLLHRRASPPPLEGVGFTYGFNSNFLTRVLDYWKNEYDFKGREEYLNKYNHYKTNIQGLDIHFMHILPKKKVDGDDVKTVPLLLLHGWPGSICEFYELIPKLMDVQPEDKFAFELVVPSLPGFGFSESAAVPGLGPAQMAVIMHKLMQRLNYRVYCIQGGDLGHTVGSIMATLYPRHVMGFHTNFPALVFNPLASIYVIFGSYWPSLTVNPEEESRMYPYMDYVTRTLEESGYMHIQATKPDTVGIALSDSPAGLAAYILEKFSTWTNPEHKRASDGNLLGKFSMAHLLDNIMVYWVTNSITTSMRVYAETINSKRITIDFDSIPTLVPTWGIKFKHELVYHPDYVLRLKYKKYLHSTLVEDGGHFAAMENPDIMAVDIKSAVKTFLQYRSPIISKRPPTAAETQPSTVYDFTVLDIQGREVKLDKYRGNVLIIVNVASECGLTETNYKEFNQLHEKYYERGLRILAFPCNQFGGQEPGGAKEILTFIKKNDLKLDFFEKVEVNGEKTHPLWKFLKQAQGGSFGDFIKWNFSKFIVDRNGVPVERFGPNVNPLELESNLQKYL